MLATRAIQYHVFVILLIVIRINSNSVGGLHQSSLQTAVDNTNTNNGINPGKLINCHCMITTTSRQANNDTASIKAQCQEYRNCKTCILAQDGCASCPQSKFGQWCDKDCPCHNGGHCLQYGACLCRKFYTGNLCQFRTKMHLIQAHNGMIRKRGITCPAPTIPSHGRAAIEFAILRPGDVVKYHCNEGYTMIGVSSRQCLETGRWSDDKPTCEKVCPFPVVSSYEGLTYEINPGRQEQELDSSGNIIIRELLFSCAEDYTLLGAARLRCLSGGSWDRDPPTCGAARAAAKSCPDPGIPVNGQRLPNAISMYLTGSVLRFLCHEDFQLIGYSMTVCTDSGSWTSSIPQCSPHTSTGGTTADTEDHDPSPELCPVPKAPKYGSVSLETPDFSMQVRYKDNSFLRIHSRINYKCEDFYILDSYPTRRCLPRGKWSGREPSCIPLCGKLNDPKVPFIINGTATSTRGWPWQAALTLNGLGLYCAGTLISEHWVITAAHCISNDVVGEDVVYVVLGKYYRNNDMDDVKVVTRSAEELIIHPNYGQKDQPNFDSDIGLIKLNGPVQFNERIRPLCLPSVYSRVTYQKGNLGVAAGWGITETGESSTELVYVTLPVVPSDKCEDNYKKSHINARVTDNMFCAGYDEGGQNTCRGDSGGAMAFDEGEPNDPRFVLEGIVSWGYDKGCARPGFYGGFVRVRNFVPWILSFVDDL